MKFARFAGTFCRNVRTFGANLYKLFPDLRIRYSKVGKETSKLGARMNRSDCKDFKSLTSGTPSDFGIMPLLVPVVKILKKLGSPEKFMRKQRSNF